MHFEEEEEGEELDEWEIEEGASAELFGPKLSLNLKVMCL